MTYSQLQTWGYRLNQLTRWSAPFPELVTQAEEWGFAPLEARAMAELAEALQADERFNLGIPSAEA